MSGNFMNLFMRLCTDKSSVDLSGLTEDDYKFLNEITKHLILKGHIDGQSDIDVFLLVEILLNLEIYDAGYSGEEYSKMIIPFLSNLKHLAFDFYSCNTIPVVNSNKLQTFEVANSNIEIIPDYIFSNNRIKKISIYDNKYLKEMSIDQSNTTSLEQLLFCNNSECYFPKLLLRVPTLTELNLERIVLDKEDFLNIKSLNNLIFLCLKNIDYTAPFLCEFPDKIISLDLSGNSLNSHSDFFALPTTLENLWLCNNDYDEIPKWVSRAKNITHLCLNGNNIEFLPPWLLDMEFLFKVQVCDNLISEDNSVVKELRRKNIIVDI